MFDDEAPKKPRQHEVGTALDTLSIDELNSRIELLTREIERLRSAIKAKSASRDAAESFFRKS